DPGPEKRSSGRPQKSVVDRCARVPPLNSPPLSDNLRLLKRQFYQPERCSFLNICPSRMASRAALPESPSLVLVTPVINPVMLNCLCFSSSYVDTVQCTTLPLNPYYRRFTQCTLGGAVDHITM
ncbi:MAG TPA: hypothetical protein VMU28_07285, partial [Terriglobales bacterium]|nr:hypothetical protein [Terriglobales bacterium]